MSWFLQKDKLQKFARKFDKSVVLCSKDNFISKFIAWFLYIFSFGKYKRGVYLNELITTIGNFIFIPENATVEQVSRIIPHEARHAQQMRWFGFGIHPIVGLVPMMIVYVLLFFPVFLALPRVLLEIDAELYRLRFRVEKKISSIDEAELTLYAHCWLLARYPYFWSMPESWIRWIGERMFKKVFK